MTRRSVQRTPGCSSAGSFSPWRCGPSSASGSGVLIPSQVAAIVVVLAFTQFVEPILRAAASVWDWTAEVGQFLPGAASDALVGSSIFTSLAQGPTAARMLEWWQGGLVLLGIAVVAAAVGYLTSWRSDVT